MRDLRERRAGPAERSGGQVPRLARDRSDRGALSHAGDHTPVRSGASGGGGRGGGARAPACTVLPRPRRGRGPVPPRPRRGVAGAARGGRREPAGRGGLVRARPHGGRRPPPAFPPPPPGLGLAGALTPSPPAPPDTTAA